MHKLAAVLKKHRVEELHCIVIDLIGHWRVDGIRRIVQGIGVRMLLRKAG